MSDLQTAMASFQSLATSANAHSNELQQCTQAVAAAIPQSSGDEIDHALGTCQKLLDDARVHRLVIQQLALLAGSMVEAGGDPEICGWTLLLLLGESLSGTKQYCEHVLEHARSHGHARPDDDGQIWMTEQLLNGYLKSVMEHDPYIGWQVFNWQSYSSAAIAHLGHSKVLRTKFPENKQLLLEVSQELDALFQAPASFLTKMLQVLDDETLLVLHPRLQQGFRCTIGGVADNFQLHALLAREFVDADDPAKLNLPQPNSRDTLNACQTYLTGDDRPLVTGVFNLLAWTACHKEARLPENTESEHWIWNEGVPADIPQFQGTRVVLLDEPSYERTWPAGRLFSGLDPDFRLDEVLNADSVEKRLNELAASNE